MPKDSSANPNNMCIGKQVVEPPHHELEMGVLPPAGIKSRVHASNYMIVTAVSSVRLGLEYPFWSIRVNMQSNPSKNTSTFKTIKNIHETSGFRGFYPGAGPYFLSSLCKQAYRLPAISLLPEYFKSWVPDNWESHYGLPHIAAVSSLAVAETMVFGPIERVVRYKMVNTEASKLTARFLYTGTGIGLAQNLLAWNLFAGLENFAQTQSRNFLKKETLNTKETFGVGLFVGISMTVITQPLDAMQTFSQTRAVKDAKPFLTAFKQHIVKHGIMRTCFSGTVPATIQGIIGASTTVFALEALRNRSKSLLESCNTIPDTTAKKEAAEKGHRASI